MASHMASKFTVQWSTRLYPDHNTARSGLDSARAQFPSLVLGLQAVAGGYNIVLLTDDPIDAGDLVSYRRSINSFGTTHIQEALDVWTFTDFVGGTV